MHKQRSAVLVTGGAGYIGSHVAWELVEAGYRTIVLDDLSTGHRANIPPRCPLVRGSVSDTELVRKVLREEKVGAVLHFAGSIVVEESFAEPLRYYENNTVATVRLLEACRAEGVPHFIYSSTAAVYGAAAGEPLRESAPARPASPYGFSKLMAERVLSDAARAFGLRSVALRYFNVAGAHRSLRAGPRSTAPTHLVRRACQAALGTIPELAIFGDEHPTPDGTCVRDYIHVVDLARAHLEALAHLERGGESLTLNCGYGRGHSVREVVETVKRVAGVDFTVRMAAAREGEVARVVADSRLLRERFPEWRPAFAELREIVASALAWERELARPSAAAGARASAKLGAGTREAV